MIHLKSAEEVELIRENCLIVSQALTRVAEILKPGITGLEIDKAATEVIKDNQAVPGFLGYGGFPGTLCISVNECVVHGIPTNKEFKEGDIVSVDCGSVKHGYNGDAAYTFAIGEVSNDVMELLVVTKESLYIGIEKAMVGSRIGCIGEAIQKYCEKKHNYGVVRELVGHGIGKSLHEKPNVPNYGKCGKGAKMKPGMTIAIEPMITLGSRKIVQLNDGWSVVTQDRKQAAHYEHSICITDKGPDILSDHNGIEEAIKNNKNLSIISRKK